MMVTDKLNKIERWIIKGLPGDRSMSIRSSSRFSTTLAVEFICQINNRERGSLIGEGASNYKDALINAYKALALHFPELDA